MTRYSILPHLLTTLRDKYRRFGANPNRLRGSARQLMKTGLETFDLELRRRVKTPIPRAPDDFSSAPIWFDYTNNKHGVLIKGDIKIGRARPFFRLGPDTNHPFVLAVTLAKDAPFEAQHELIFMTLSKYYSQVAPTHVGQFLPINKDSPLYSQPPWTFPVPWEPVTIDGLIQRRRYFTKVENSRIDPTSRVTIDKGWTWIGPAHPDKIEIETLRTLSLMRSIQKNGYERTDLGDGDICIQALIYDDQNWVWRVTAGLHRACTLAGLGWTEFPLRLLQVIRRDDAAYWPGVRSKIYTKQEALDFFDMCFDGSLSNKFPNLDKFVQNHKQTHVH